MVVDHHQCFGVVLPPAMWFKTEKSTQKWFQNTKASSNIKELETLSMEVSSMIHLHMSTIDYMKRLSAFCAHKKTLLEKTLYFDIRLQSVSVCYIFITKCKKK